MPEDVSDPASDPAAAPEGTSDDAATSLADIAAEYDVQALAALRARPAGGTAGGEDGSAGRGTTPPVLSPKIKDFIDRNYGGDEDAFFHAQYENRAEGKRQAEKIRELETRISSPPPPPTPDLEETFKEVRTTSPEIQAIDLEIKALDEDSNAANTKLASLATQAGGVQKEIATLNGSLINATDEAKPAILFKIAQQEALLAKLETSFEANERTLRSNQLDRRKLSRELGQLENSIRSEIEDDVRHKRATAQHSQIARQSFENTYAKVAGTTYGLDPNSETYKYLERSVRHDLREHLMSLGPDAPAVTASDIASITNDLFTTAAVTFGLKPKGKGNGGRPPAPRSLHIPRAPTPAANIPGPPRPGPSDVDDSVLESLSPKDRADFYRRRADAIYSAMGKAEASRGRGGPLG